MTLNDMINRAANGYPDGYVLVYWDPKKQRVKQNPVNGGDTLAKFIAAELKDTFDPDAPEANQVETAVAALQRAVDELQGVISALENSVPLAETK